MLADRMDALPEGDIVLETVKDYSILRDQTRVCRGD